MAGKRKRRGTMRRSRKRYKSATATKSYVRKVIAKNLETKSRQIYNNTVQVPLTWTLVASPTEMPVGDALSEREGATIKLKSLSIRGFMQSQTALTHDFVRICVVYFKSDPTSVLGINSVMKGNDNSAAAVTIADIVNFKAQNTRFGSKILYDKVHQIINYMGYDSADAISVKYRMFNFRIPLNGRSCRYEEGVTSGDVDPVYGAIKIYACSLLNGTTNTTIRIATKLNYTDG